MGGFKYYSNYSSYPYNLAVDLLGLTLLSRTAEDISEMDLLEATVVFFPFSFGNSPNKFGLVRRADVAIIFSSPTGYAGNHRGRTVE
jgi:hypothetical protein